MENKSEYIILVDEKNREHKYLPIYNLDYKGLFIIAAQPADNKDSLVLFQLSGKEIVPVRNDDLITEIHNYLNLINKINAGQPVFVTDSSGQEIQCNIIDKIQLNNRIFALAFIIKGSGAIAVEETPAKNISDAINGFVQEKLDRTKVSEADIAKLVNDSEKVSDVLYKRGSKKERQVKTIENNFVPSPEMLQTVVFEDTPKGLIVVTDENIIGQLKEKLAESMKLADDFIPKAEELLTGRFKEELVVIKDRNGNFMECTTVGRFTILNKEYLFLSPAGEPERVFAAFINQNKELEVLTSKIELTRLQHYINKLVEKKKKPF